jgi:hypothetical protein
MSYNIYEIKDFYSLLYHVDQRIKQLIYEDSKKHQMDAEPGWVIQEIEDEFQPVLTKVLETLDYDPTPQYLYDNDGGEPPMTANEMHSAAWKEHQALHS